MAAALFVLLAFQPLSDVIAEGTAPPGTPPQTASLSAPPPQGPTDSPGGPSPPPGTANAIPAPPETILSTLPPERRAPILDREGGDYRYTTVAGRYTFPGTRPYVVRHDTRGGESSVVASTFVVLPGVTLFRDPEVLEASGYEYRVRYGIAQAGRTIGNVTLTYDFRDDGPPKITAQLRHDMTQFLSLAWVALSRDTVAFNGTEARDFRDAELFRMDTPTYRLAVGPDLDPPAWRKRLSLDWRDARAGVAYAGRVSFGGLEGAAVLVKFPIGMKTVDPVLVSEDAASTATAHAIQRKAFVYADRYWAFWYDGTNIVYASSRNGADWTAPLPAGGAGAPRGFDVDQRDGTVLLAYVPSGETELAVKRGTVTGDHISWGSCVGPDAFDRWTGWPASGASPPTVAIGADGYYWVTVIRKSVASGDGSPMVYVYRSDGPDSSTFELSAKVPAQFFMEVNPAIAAVRILALPNGYVVLVQAAKGWGRLYTYAYASSGWGYGGYWIFDIDTNHSPQDVLSGLILPDGRMRFAFRASSGALKIGTLTLPSGPLEFEELDASPREYPAITLDRAGDTHVFAIWPESGSSYRLRYVRPLPLSGEWAAAIEPVPPATVARSHLTIASFAPSYIPVLWTEGQSGYGVWFSGVPTPLDLGSQAGQPWNRQGLSPYQAYFRSFGESVSPGSGLLAVKHVDHSLPGRGLTLEFSRVYVTPRAFLSTSPDPYLYEDYPGTPLGVGWRPNFPWISDQYVHLWDGQMYVVEWDGDVFENHDGEHFTLTRTFISGSGCGGPCYTYALEAKSGLRHEFDTLRRLAVLKDRAGNEIRFDYDSGRMAHAWDIADALNRKITFTYNPDGTLASASTRAQKVTYTYAALAGKTVLVSARDPLGRSTTYGYVPTQPYLLSSVGYPTGGRTVYIWGAPVPLFGDLTSYYVGSQDTQNAAGQSIRANAFLPTIVGGKVTYADILAFDAGVLQGSTALRFDALARRVVTTIRDAAGTRLGETVTWFGALGPEQIDSYPGASTAPSHSTRIAYDEWGNVVYTRDGIGHERFASFANTRHEGGFLAPGRLTATASGLAFFDDFEDRSLDDWDLMGAVDLSDDVFESLPPVMKLEATSPTAAARAVHGAVIGPDPFWMQAVVRMEDESETRRIRLVSDSTTAVEITFSGGQITRSNPGPCLGELGSYTAGEWYWVTINVLPPSYVAYVDGPGGQWNCGDVAGSGGVNQVEFEQTCSACPSSFSVDAVRVWKSPSGGPSAVGFTVAGLDESRIVQFYDTMGQRAGIGQASASGTVTLDFSAYVGSTRARIGNLFPGGALVVLDRTWNVELASPARDFWAGDAWAYTPPRREMGLVRTRSGFVPPNIYPYVDDQLPEGAVTSDGEDGWDWGEHDFPVSDEPPAPALAHRAKLLSGYHDHSFGDGTYGQFVGDSFYLQYLFIPQHQSPGEIWIRLQTGSIPPFSWNPGAYWGDNLACESDPQSPACSAVRVGDLPGLAGRWMMVLARGSHINPGNPAIRGISYGLWGGRATWDFSAIESPLAGPATGGVTIAFDPPGSYSGWSAEILRADGTSIASDDVDGQGVAFMDLYNAASPVRTFPLEAYVAVKQGATVRYRSPVLEFWGGDQYAYAPTNFYADGSPVASIRDRVLGTVEFQDGPGPGEVRQGAHVKYNPDGSPDLQKVWDGTAWRETSYEYLLGYGLVTSVTDPLLRSLNFGYSSTYGMAYVTSASDAVGTTQSTFDPRTGWTLSEKNGRGYRTRYAYDGLGRVTDARSFDTTSALLYWDMETSRWIGSVEYMDDLSPNVFDGRLVGATSTAGRWGEARDFPDFASSQVVTDVAFPAGWRTLAGWFRVDRWNDGVFDTVLAAHGGRSEASYVHLRVKDQAQGRFLYLEAKGGAGVESVVTDFVPTVGQWFHAIGVLDGPNSRVYVNGVVRGAGPTTGPSASQGQFAVGADVYLDGNLEGAADEVYVFGAALTDAVAGDLYQNEHALLASLHVAYDDGANVLTTYEPGMKPRLAHLDMESVLCCSSVRIEDLSGHGSNGVPTGTVPATGRIGEARRFQGTGHEVAVPLPSVSTTPDTDVTVAFWMWWDGAPTQPGQIPLGFLSYALWFVGTDFGFTTGSGDVWGISSAGLAGRWVHVAAVFHNGDATRSRLYIDGLPQTMSQMRGTTGDRTLSSDLRFGTWPNNGAYPFFGVIDEVHVFNESLSDADVPALFDGTERGSYSKGYFDSIGRKTRAVQRDLFGSIVAWEEYTYDFRDRVVRIVTSTGATTEYTYDFLGRPTLISPPDSVTLWPSGPGGSTAWTRGGAWGCAANQGCADEALSGDGDVTHVTSTTYGNTDDYAMGDTAAGGEIASVTVYAVARSDGTCISPPPCDFEADLLLRVNGDSWLAPVPWGSYLTVSHTWALNPATTLPWTVDEVNDVEAGIRNADIDPGTQIWVTQLYVVVDFGDAPSTTVAYDDLARTRTMVEGNGRKLQTFRQPTGMPFLSRR